MAFVLMPPTVKQPIPVFEEVKWERVTENKISTVMSFLPVSVATRIAPIRSIRRSMSLYNLQSRDMREDSLTKPRPLSEADAAVFSQGSFVSEVVGGKSLDKDTTGLEVAPVRNRRLGFDVGNGPTPARTASGIHWKFARQGKLLGSG